MPRSSRTGTPLLIDPEIEKTAKNNRKQTKLQKLQLAGGNPPGPAGSAPSREHTFRLPPHRVDTPVCLLASDSDSDSDHGLGLSPTSPIKRLGPDHGLGPSPTSEATSVAKGTPCITDSVIAELEKLGQKYRVALRIAKDPIFERLPCTHKEHILMTALLKESPR
ncbi:hypothetical protein LXL04_027131 [Taraxacum kok-saghyz]